MLDVHDATESSREELLLVGGAVAVGVRVLPDFVGVRLFRQDGVLAERHHEPREDQVIDEDVMRLVDAVVVAIFVHGNPARGPERAAAVGVLHIAAELEHEHAAVAVESDLRRLLNLRIGEHRRHREPGWQQELPGFLFGRQWQHRRLLREIRLDGRVATRAARVWRCAGAAGAPLSRRRLRQQRIRSDGQRGENDDEQTTSNRGHNNTRLPREEAAERRGNRVTNLLKG
jgi:hypothetical protein